MHRNLVHESRQIGSGQTRDGKSECRHSKNRQTQMSSLPASHSSLSSAPGPYPILRRPQRQWERAPCTHLDHAPTTPPTTPLSPPVQPQPLSQEGRVSELPSFPLLTYLLCLVLQLAQVSTDKDDVQTSPGELQEMHSFIYSRKP